jgi:hypothetical protein
MLRVEAHMIAVCSRKVLFHLSEGMISVKLPRNLCQP